MVTYRLWPYNFFRLKLGVTNSNLTKFSQDVQLRNDCRLSCKNQNCDTPLRFRTPVCQMNENREISAESQRNFHFLPHFNSKTTGPNFTKFSRGIRGIIYAVNALTEITISHSVSDRAISAGVGNFATKLVAIATSLEESEKLDRIEKVHANTFHLVKRS